MSESTGALALADRLAALGPDRLRLLRDKLRAAGDPVAAAGPVPVPRDGRILPATFFQERLYLVDQLLPGSAAYTVTLAFRIRGAVDADVLRRSWAYLVDRHEILRTGLEWIDGVLAQVPRPGCPVPFELVDLTGASAPDADLERSLTELAETVFDLSRAPLLRTRLIRVAPGEHVLGIALHHAVTDGWSNGILLHELGVAYRAFAADRAPALEPVALRYADAAVWQRNALTDQRLETLLAYWGGQLAGAPALLDLPTDRPRVAGGARPGAEEQFDLSVELADRLRALARSERSTNFMVILAGFAATLARWSGQADILVGTPQTGRTHPALENVVGPFVNTVVLRLNVDDGTTMRDLLRQARRVSVVGQAHADLPFEKLVERLRPRRGPLYNPVFQVNLGVGNFPRTNLDLPGLTAEPVELAGGQTAKFDLSLYVDESDDRWDAVIVYNADLFTADTIRWFIAGLTTLLEAAAHTPDTPIRTLLAGAGGGSGTRNDGGPLHAEAAAFVPPRGRWETIVAGVWSQVLDIDEVGATDNFFALGGHSMAGMLVLERLWQLTGRRLSLAVFFAGPTVEQLATAVRAGDVAGEEPFVATLQPAGDGSPLFFLPVTVDQLAAYLPLARALGTDRPIFGLQSGGFFRAGSPGELSVEELAARYAEEIVLASPGSTYNLCGFSAGGRIALAVAEVLAARGERVGAVVMLDTAPLGDVEPEPDLPAILARWLDYAPPAEELRELDRDGQLAAVLAAGRRMGDLPPGFDPADMEQLCARLELTGRALANHLQLSYVGRATLFARLDPGPRDIVPEWDAFPIGELVVQRIDVETHMDFVIGAGVPLVAAALNTHLDAVDREQEQP